MCTGGHVGLGAKCRPLRLLRFDPISIGLGRSWPASLEYVHQFCFCVAKLVVVKRAPRRKYMVGRVVVDRGLHVVSTVGIPWVGSCSSGQRMCCSPASLPTVPRDIETIHSTLHQLR